MLNIWAEKARRKQERRASKPRRKNALRSQYAREKREGTFRLDWAVLNCHFRQGFTIRECADVLNESEDAIEFAIDMTIQNAR